MRTLRIVLICGLLAAAMAGGAWALGWMRPLTENVFAGGQEPGRAVAEPWFWQWLGMLALAAGLAWTTIDLSSWPLRGVVAAIALAEAAVLSWLLRAFGVVWPPFATLLAGGLAVACGALYLRSGPARRKRRLDELFAGRLSPELYRQTLDARAPLPANGEEREASLILCQLGNRRELAGTMDAVHFVELSNDFLRLCSQALMEEGGALTECGNGQAQAIFGVPLASFGHAERACEAAWALFEQFSVFRWECEERWGVHVECAIAVTSGPLIFGRDLEGGFTVAGGPLEQGRALCGLAATYGTPVLMGSRAFQLGRGAPEMRPVDKLWNPDTQADEEFYEILGLRDTLTDEELHQRELYWGGLMSFRRGRWGEAMEQFEAALEASRETDRGDDPLTRYYLRRTRKLRAEEPRALPEPGHGGRPRDIPRLPPPEPDFDEYGFDEPEYNPEWEDEC